jgi:hypothetical protein
MYGRRSVSSDGIQVRGVSRDNTQSKDCGDSEFHFELYINQEEDVKIRLVVIMMYHVSAELGGGDDGKPSGFWGDGFSFDVHVEGHPINTSGS